MEHMVRFGNTLASSFAIHGPCLFTGINSQVALSNVCYFWQRRLANLRQHTVCFYAAAFDFLYAHDRPATLYDTSLCRQFAPLLHMFTNETNVQKCFAESSSDVNLILLLLHGLQGRTQFCKNSLVHTRHL